MARTSLTKPELQILEVLWTRGACSIREIHEALPAKGRPAFTTVQTVVYRLEKKRSEEHTSELQSHSDLVCRLLLEKKKKTEKKRKKKKEEREKNIEVMNSAWEAMTIEQIRKSKRDRREHAEMKKT